MCAKDSRALTEHDLQSIETTVLDKCGRYVVITMGTFQMAPVARRLNAHFLRDKSERMQRPHREKSERTERQQTVVLCGAMVPLNVVGSDGAFHLGFALAAVKTLPPGCYVAMHGEVFEPASVKKDVQNNRFVDSKL